MLVAALCRVDKSAGPDAACWPWLGARHGFGYGVFRRWNHGDPHKSWKHVS